METPREIPQEPRERERAERTPETQEAGAEAADAEVERAAKEFESEGAAFESAGAAEFARVTRGGDIPQETVDADPGVQDAKRDLDAAAAQGRRVVDGFKGRLAGIGPRLKRFGRAVVAGAVLSGSAMNVAEAAAPPDRGPSVEHVERGNAKTPEEVRREAKEQVLSRADVLDQIKRTLAKETGSDAGAEGVLREFAGQIERWREEDVVGEYAKLAGMRAEDFARKRLKEIVVLTDAQVERMRRDDPTQETGFNAMFREGKMFLKVSEFIRNGKLDAGMVQHAQTHEEAHNLSEEPKPGSKTGEAVRPWDSLGVPPAIGEAAAEALALAADRNRGLDVGYQAYAGGNLAAGRLLQEAVGVETLAKDYFRGRIDGVRGALDRKFGPGAGDAVLRTHFEKKMSMEEALKQKPEGLAAVMELVNRGIDAEGAWRQAREKEGYAEGLTVAPDRRSVVLTKEINGEMRVANGVFEDPDPMSPNSPPLRIFGLTVGSGDRPGAAYVEQAAAALRNSVEINERTAQELRAQLRDAYGPDFMRVAEARQLYEENLQGNRAAAKEAAGKEGKPTADFNLIIDLREELRPMMARYKAASPELRKRIEAEMAAHVDAVLRETARKIRLEMQTPPIPLNIATK